MVWPFGRREPKAQTGGGTSATELALAALDREAAGRTVDAHALALAESCVGLWERAMASAQVGPDGMALAPVSPAVMALVGRSLATRGNALFVIDVGMSGQVTLHPVSSWDPRGGYRPESRRYYCTLSAPQGTVTRNLPSAAVLHFRVGASDVEWWRGRAPLYRASATAAVAARLEKQILDETKIPVGRIVPLALPAPTDETADLTDRIRKGGLTVIPTGHGPAGEQMPSQRYAPQKMGAHPAEPLPRLRSDVGHEICTAFGVPPALVTEGSDGTAQRESWRRFWLGTIAPLGRLIRAELAAKLDSAATVDFEALAAADEDGRSRAISRRASAFKTFADAGIPRAEALRLAGIEA